MPDTPDRDSRGYFLPGHKAPPGVGRPPGYRAKLAAGFVKALFEDFDKHGTGVIEQVRLNDPSTYVRILAQMLPKEITGEEGGPIITSVTYKWADPPPVENDGNS